MGKISLVLGVVILATAVTNLPKWLKEGVTPAPSWTRNEGRDLRVNTPDGLRYPGMPYFSETTINGKRYHVITTYRTRR